MTALTLTCIVSAVLMAIGMAFSSQITELSGAAKLSEEMRKLSADYLFYYSAFSIPMLLSNCLSVFVRNDGSPTLSFVGMCTGAAANIFFDWLFVFPFQWGVIGAAVASGMGQIFSLLVLSSHFVRKKGDLRIRRFRLKGALVGKICKRGVPEGVTQLTPPVTALCYNLMLARLVGDIGVENSAGLQIIFVFPGILPFILRLNSDSCACDPAPVPAGPHLSFIPQLPPKINLSTARQDNPNRI